MTSVEAVVEQLERVPGVEISPGAPLREYTRFGLGGPAKLLVDAATEAAFVAVHNVFIASDVPIVVIGGGSNLVVSDEGFHGAVLRFTGTQLQIDGSAIDVEAGVILQDLVDASIDAGLSGIHTMTGIPGWVGGAVYGNAGAYGRSIDQAVRSVRFFDGEDIREISGEECRFRYRESVFKEDKSRIIFSVTLELQPGSAVELRRAADEILSVRNAKYPPTMKCAGSIFKNLLLAELPDSARQAIRPEVIREGKVPSAFFLEAVGAKGMRNGGIHVADYHANLIYNDGGGTARQVHELAGDLKQQVKKRFNLVLEEEVQYVGF